MTSRPLRPQYSTSAEHSDHMGEPEPSQPPLCSSPRANVPLSKSMPTPTFPASKKASASLPNKEKMQEGQLPTSQIATRAAKALRASSPTEMARIGRSDRDTGGRTDRVHTTPTASSINPSSTCNIQMNDDMSSISPSSVRNRHEPLPHS